MTWTPTAAQSSSVVVIVHVDEDAAAARRPPRLHVRVLRTQKNWLAGIGSGGRSECQEGAGNDRAAYQARGQRVGNRPHFRDHRAGERDWIDKLAVDVEPQIHLNKVGSRDGGKGRLCPVNLVPFGGEAEFRQRRPGDDDVALNECPA